MAAPTHLLCNNVKFSPFYQLSISLMKWMWQKTSIHTHRNVKNWWDLFPQERFVNNVASVDRSKTSMLFYFFRIVIMPPFRWPELKMYIDLAREVAGNNSQKPAEWEALAARLSSAFSSVGKPGVELKGRGCRQRLDNLVEKYKAEDARSLNSRYKPSSCCNIGLHLPRVPLVVLGKFTAY